MTNPNNCDGCRWSRDKRGGGHCYMFRDAPDEVCYQHTERTGSQTIDFFFAGNHRMTSLGELSLTLFKAHNDQDATLDKMLPDADSDLSVHVTVTE